MYLGLTSLAVCLLTQPHSSVTLFDSQMSQKSVFFLSSPPNQLHFSRLLETMCSPIQKYPILISGIVESRCASSLLTVDRSSWCFLQYFCAFFQVILSFKKMWLPVETIVQSKENKKMNTVTVAFISTQMIYTMQPLRVHSDKGIFFYIKHDKTNRKALTNQPFRFFKYLGNKYLNQMCCKENKSN